MSGSPPVVEATLGGAGGAGGALVYTKRSQRPVTVTSCGRVGKVVPYFAPLLAGRYLECAVYYSGVLIGGNVSPARALRARDLWGSQIPLER